jgi:hypothetical protein
LKISEHPYNLQLQELRSLVATSWRQQRLQLLRRVCTFAPPVAEVAPRQAESVEQLPAEVTKVQLQSWIVLELVDGRGRPVRDTRVEVTDPSGQVRTMRSDQQGCIRLERIDPGQCKFHFPATDGA